MIAFNCGWPTIITVAKVIYAFMEWTRPICFLMVICDENENWVFTSLSQSVLKVTHTKIIVCKTVPPNMPDHIPCKINTYIRYLKLDFEHFVLYVHCVSTSNNIEGLALCLGFPFNHQSL